VRSFSFSFSFRYGSFLHLSPAVVKRQLVSEALCPLGVFVCVTGWTGLGWTGLGAATPVAPQELEGSTPWRTCYKVARNKQGITASFSLTYSNTAIAELTTACCLEPEDQILLQLTQTTSGSQCSINLALHSSRVTVNQTLEFEIPFAFAQ